jgi:hypothetical protein
MEERHFQEQQMMDRAKLEHENVQMGSQFFNEAKKAQDELVKKGTVGEAYQAAITNQNKIKDIIANPEKYNTPSGNVEVVDTFVRTFNGNSAIRIGQLAQMGINRNFEDRIKAYAQQYEITHQPVGGKFSPRELKVMAEAVNNIAPQLKPAFQDAAREAMKDLSVTGMPHPEMAVPYGLREGLFDDHETHQSARPISAPQDAVQAPDGHWYSKNTGPDAKTHPYVRWD